MIYDDEWEDLEDIETGRGSDTMQVKIGPDGNLVIDETALFRQKGSKQKGSTNKKGTKNKKSKEQNSTTKTRVKARWGYYETVLFYKCLRAVGANFLEISKLIPGTTREDIKAKFKHEENVFPHLITKALSFSRADLIEEIPNDLAMIALRNEENRKFAGRCRKMDYSISGHFHVI